MKPFGELSHEKLFCLSHNQSVIGREREKKVLNLHFDHTSAHILSLHSNQQSVLLSSFDKIIIIREPKIDL